MPEIAQSGISGFIRDCAGNSAVRAVLVHGNDGGAVAELAARLLAAAAQRYGDGSETVQLDESAIAAEPDALRLALTNRSMFAAYSLVHLRRAATAAAKALAACDGLWNTASTFVVIEAEALRKDSALRKLFARKAEDRAAIALYEDKPSDLRSMVTHQLAANKLHADEDTVAAIATRLGENRAVARHELEKLALYAGRQGSISVGDVDQVMAGSEVRHLSRLIDATFDGRLNAFEPAFRAVWSLGSGGIVLMNAASRHCGALYGAVVAHNQQYDRRDTLALLEVPNSPSFWALERQGRRWNLAALAKAREAIFQASLALRATGAPEVAIVHRALMRTALIASRL